MSRTATGLAMPPRLREGARVALIAPAGPVAAERIDIAIDRCARLGLQPVEGASARRRHAEYLAGTDDDRLHDLEWALTSGDVDAVWALRGGYGTMRLLPKLQLSTFDARPRVFMGFSDNTALHFALHAHRVVSFHAPHAGGAASALAEDCLRQVLFSSGPAGLLPVPADARLEALSPGVAEAPLIGGNLSLLAALCGSAVAPVARGCILFVEDIGETAYRLDRAWTQLVLAGVLDGVAGVLLGQFTDCGDDTLDLFRRLTAPLDVPVLAGLPIGHEDDNWTLPLGVRARLDAGAGTVELLEAAVT